MRGSSYARMTGQSEQNFYDTSPGGATVQADFESIFLVMDYTEQDLQTVMRSVRNGTMLSEDHIITLAYNMLCGLNVLHTAGLIHRDLKPANILVGDSCSVKFCDFGLSCMQPRR